MSTIRTNGFVTYEEASADILSGSAVRGVVAAYPLTSAPAGSLVVGASQAFKDKLNFTADGMQFTPDNDALHKIGLRIPAFPAASTALLNIAGHLAFDIDSLIFNITRTYQTSQNYLFVGGSSLSKTSNSQQMNFLNPSASVALPASTDVGKSTKSRVVVSWNNGYVQMYINKLKVADWAKTTGGQFSFYISGAYANLYLGGDGSNFGGPWGVRIKNFHISTQPICIPVNPKLRNVALAGHSFCLGGGYCPTAKTGSYLTGSLVAETGTADLSTSYGIHRKIMQRGYNMGKQIINTGISGSRVYSLLAQIATLAANRNNMDFLVIQTGINNFTPTAIKAGVADAQTTDITDLTVDYKAVIDLAVATWPNIRKIIICNIATGTVMPSLNTAVPIANIAATNAMIDTLPAYNSRVSIVDQFNLMGGLNYTSSYFANPGTEDPHLSALGYNIVGEAVGDLIVSSV